jgi:TRAP transporter TAXI family solute receptor
MQKREGYMKKRMLLFWTILVLLSGFLSVPLSQADRVGIVTGSSAGTYIQFGYDIARVGRKAGLDIWVRESKGSVDNISKLVDRKENAAFAIVQSDVLQFLKKAEDPEMRRFARKLRLVFPFYNEEVHLLARKEIRSFEDLDGKRVILGLKGSGNRLTSRVLLGLFNIRPSEDIQVPPAKGVATVLAGEADAVFYVAGKPVKLFTKLGELRRDPRRRHLLEGVHFVPLHHEKMRRLYVASTIGPRDYKWLERAVPTIAVKAVLICYDFSSRRSPYFDIRCEQLSKLGRVVRENFDELKRNGHPKWKEVDLDKEIGLWKRDSCSQPVGPESKIEEELIRELTDFLTK